MICALRRSHKRAPVSSGSWRQSLRRLTRLTRLSLAPSLKPGNLVLALLNATLVLCADHELNSSTFAARVVASAEANPYAVVLAGLAALGGFQHGGAAEQAAAFLREVAEPSRVRLVIAERLRRGERLPGFGHRLYPDHDPRAVALLSMLAEAYPTSPALALAII